MEQINQVILTLTSTVQYRTEKFKMLSSNSSSKTANEKGGNVPSFEKLFFKGLVCTSCIREMPPPEEERCLCKDELTEKKIRCNLYS